MLTRAGAPPLTCTNIHREIRPPAVAHHAEEAECPTARTACSASAATGPRSPTCGPGSPRSRPTSCPTAPTCSPGDEAGPDRPRLRPGAFDATLERAVRAFQQHKGLIVDGVVGVETFTAIDGARWALGDRILLHTPGHLLRGEDVVTLQERLNTLGLRGRTGRRPVRTRDRARRAQLPARLRAVRGRLGRSRHPAGLRGPAPVGLRRLRQRPARARAGPPLGPQPQRAHRRARPRPRRQPTPAPSPTGWSSPRWSWTSPAASRAA